MEDSIYSRYKPAFTHLSVPWRDLEMVAQSWAVVTLFLLSGIMCIVATASVLCVHCVAFQQPGGNIYEWAHHTAGAVCHHRYAPDPTRPLCCHRGGSRTGRGHDGPITGERHAA